MDYGNFIDKQLAKTFLRVSSLLTPVTFHLKEGEAFNFNTAATEIASESNLVTKAFVTKTTHQKDTIRRQLLIERIENLDIYDKLTMDGIEWSIGPSLLDNGHMQIIEVQNG